MKNTFIMLVLCTCLFHSCTNDPINNLNEGIETNDLERVKKALNNITDINIPLKGGTTALKKAIEKDNIAIVELLLDKGAVIKSTSKSSLIFSAKSPDMLSLLIRKGIPVNTQDSLGNSMLHYSMNLQMIAVLLEQKAKVNQQNNKGETPLMIAARLGDKELFTLLIEHEADIKIKDETGKSAVEHILVNSSLDTYWQEEEKRKALEVEKRKQEEEEKRKRLALKNEFPTKGKTGYICNYGTACQVLIKEVVGGKVKVEILEKCWPKNMTTANLSKALDSGNVRWINKSHVQKKRGSCY